MAFNFGNKPATGFGTTGFGSTGTTGTGGFSFGGKPTGTATTSAGGFSFGAGTGTATTKAGGFSFGSGLTTTTTAGASGGFSFGSGLTTTTASSGFGSGFGFGSTAKTTAPSLFGSTATTSSGFSFGTGTTTTGGFGTSTLGTGLGAQAQQQQQQQQQNQGARPDLLMLVSALSVPTIYGDERDNILRKWNQLQAFWGTGRGYINQSTNINFTPENPFNKFKTIGYSIKPKSRNADGLVVLQLNKKEADIRANQQQLVDSLFRILGSKPTLSVCVEEVKPNSTDKCDVTIYILERAPNGVTKRICATNAYNFLNQSSSQTQLGQLGVTSLIPRVQLSNSQLQEYLNNPPLGYDPRLWKQAQLDNPDPANLIPVPLIGFGQLKSRLEQQTVFSKQLQARLEQTHKELEKMEQEKNTLLARLPECRRKHQDLSHRLLQVFVKLEIQRKRGMPLQLEEEHLRTRIECLNAPTQLVGRLNEMLSHVRLQSQVSYGRAQETYELTSDMQREIKMHLTQQQEGIGHLVNVIKDDLEDLKLIEQDMSEVITSRR